MIVYRTLSEPQAYEMTSGATKYGILCLFVPTDSDIVEEDLLMFEEEGQAWKFYHEVNMSFKPLVIEDGS